MIGKSLLHYKIISELGRGGMGVVYLAEDTKLDRRVAIKFLAADMTSDERARNRFIREAKSAAAVEHEAICTIYEIGESPDGQTFIVMPYYKGETLKELIATGPIDPKTTLDYAVQIADGLRAAHQSGVVHRDIKPGNLIVDKRGRLKILDFGLAKLAGQLELTKTRSSVGTVPYMAPEQVRGEVVDARTDIWSLGAVMYEMLSGDRPFKGEYEHAVTYSILNVDPEPLASVQDPIQDRLEILINRCLAKDPSNRYQSTDDLCEDLEAVGTREPTPRITARSAEPQAAPVRSARARKKSFGLFVIPIAVAAIAIVSVLLYNYYGKAQSQQRHIAILPFKVIGQSSDAEAFSYGLLESLSSGLARYQKTAPSLWVIPTSEVTASMSLGDANRTLGANLVVTGSIQMRADQVRISLVLNDAISLRTIDSDQFDDTGSGAFAVQDEAVRRLAAMLDLVPDPGSSIDPSQSGSHSRTANDAYIKARGYLRNQQSLADLDVAIGLLTSAVSDDSTFAAAYAGLGSAYWQKYLRTDDTRWVEQALSAAETARDLNDELPEVYLTTATIRAGLKEYGAAIDAYNRVLSLEPANSEAYRLMAASLRAVGQNDEAVAALKKSIELAPDYWRGYYSLALQYFRQGDDEATIGMTQEGLEKLADTVQLLNLQAVAVWRSGRVAEAMSLFDRIRKLNPDYSNAWSNTATALFYNHRYSESAELYEKVVNRLRPNSHRYRGYLADAYYWADGKRDKAEETYHEAIELAKEALEVTPSDPDIYNSISYYYAHVGMPDSAKYYVEQALALYPPGAVPADEAIGIGSTYLALNDLASARNWIEQGLSGNEGWMQLQFSPWFAKIRDDVDFMQRMAVYRR